MNGADAGQLLGRGIGFPPRLRDGRVAFSAGEQNIREAIRVVLMTERGERLRLPEFGGDLGRFLFRPNSAAVHHQIEDRIEKALVAWEPRITVESVNVVVDPGDSEAVVATVVYKLIATQVREQVTVSVGLGG